MNQCLLVAGEKSGEEHALSFLLDLKIKLPNTHFFGVGGDELKKNNVEILYHLNDFSSWGYSEVIAKIPFYMKAMDHIVDEVIKRGCKTAILVDFQSFNLKLAGRLKSLGVNVLYYVAPQAWAWKEYRVKKLSKSVHSLFTIIPFEKEWFKNRGVDKVISVDHPMWTTYKNELENFSKEIVALNEVKPLNLLLLPGSRKFEVEALLIQFIEAYLEIKKIVPHLTLSVVKSPSVSEELFSPYNHYFQKIYKSEELLTALKNADFSLAASGTVTLTAGLFEVPTIVCYKTSLINQFIYESLVSYRGPISLLNIVHNKSVFPELLQDSVSSHNIMSYFKFWYYNKSEYLALKMQLRKTKQLVRGEALDVTGYMASVIKESYEKTSALNS